MNVLMNPQAIEITALLTRWKSGDRSVENELMNCIYLTLVDIARSQVRRNAGEFTLLPAEVAHEAYTKLQAQQLVDWQNRDHFFAIAATAIRRVVIDHMRKRFSHKRGGGLPFVALDSLSDNVTPAIDDSVDWLTVDQALNELEGVDAECARVVELKFFSGLTTEQIASACGSSVATVGRQWRFSRAWLGARLGIDGASSQGS